MSKDHYLPRPNKDRGVWLNNFANKFAPSAVPLGFVAADVTSVNNDDAMFIYLINLVETFTTAKERRVNYKNLIKDGPLGKVAGTVPVTPVVAAAPTAVAAGIFPHIAQLVQRIKKQPNVYRGRRQRPGHYWCRPIDGQDYCKAYFKISF